MRAVFQSKNKNSLRRGNLKELLRMMMNEGLRVSFELRQVRKTRNAVLQKRIKIMRGYHDLGVHGMECKLQNLKKVYAIILVY